jgi:Hint domain
MANFTWTNAGGGDWSDASNWSPSIIGPPGARDNTTFNDLASSYTVTVKAGTTVGNGTAGPFISISATSALKDVAFSISGTLTADFLYGTAKSGPGTSLTIEAGGALIVPTLLFSNNAFETVTISGTGAGGYLELGDLTVGGLVSGTSSMMVLDFANTSPTVPSTGVIQFDNVDLSSSLHATQTITDVAWGDEFVIKGADFTGDTATLVGNVLSVANGGTTVFTMDNVSLEPGFTGSFVTSGDVIQAVCYARGTMIRTPDGELPVETLRPGKQVTTLVDGQEVPQTVTWLGYRRISLVGHPRPETVVPIRIERDAFAAGVPHRDLLVSPDHAIFVDGKLICARQLVNGTTISREFGWTAVDYFHVELDQHAILLAEGLPAESYLDTGNRGFFANSGMPLVLHPDLTDETGYPTREAGSCAAFVWGEANVRPAWQRLADRAAALGRAVPRRTTTTEAGLHLQCRGRQPTEPVYHDSQRAIFVLPSAAPEVRLVSRAQSPTEARPWLDDRRRLGVRVKRLVLRGADETREVPMDHPDITQGWWAVEHDGPIMSRWTDGDAALPLPTMRGSVILEIHLAGAMTYAMDPASEGVAERRIAWLRCAP